MTVRACSLARGNRCSLRRCACGTGASSDSALTCDVSSFALELGDQCDLSRGNLAVLATGVGRFEAFSKHSFGKLCHGVRASRFLFGGSLKSPTMELLRWALGRSSCAGCPVWSCLGFDDAWARFPPPGGPNFTSRSTCIHDAEELSKRAVPRIGARSKIF